MVMGTRWRVGHVNDGSGLVSYQTTMARAELAHWEQQWRTHKLGCAECSIASRARRWGGCCHRGAANRQEMIEARARLEHERELDKAPILGQGTLL
jgi:hypothetical protein